MAYNIKRSRLKVRKYQEGGTAVTGEEKKKKLVASGQTDIKIDPTVMSPQTVEEFNQMAKWNAFQSWLAQQRLEDKTPVVGNTALDKASQKQLSDNYIKQWNDANPDVTISPDDIRKAQTFAGIRNDRWLGSQTSQIRYNVPGVQTYKIQDPTGDKFTWGPKGTKPGGTTYPLANEQEYRNLKRYGILPPGTQLPTFAGGGKVGNFFHNYGTALADNVLSTIGAGNVINQADYRGPNAEKWGNITDTVGQITGAIAPMAMNAVVPGSGAFVAAGQKIIGGQLNQAYGPQQSPVDAYGMPIKQFKHGGMHRMKGTINVEGKELEVKNGKVVKDFKNKPPHPMDDSYINVLGNTLSVDGNVIIPVKMRDKYLKGDKLTRNSIEQNLSNAQAERERRVDTDMKEMFGIFEQGGAYYKQTYKDGGTIHIKPQNRGKFTSAAKRAGMGVQEYASQVMANKENYSPTLVKRANFARNAAKWKREEGGLSFPNFGTNRTFRQPLLPEMDFSSPYRTSGLPLPEFGVDYAANTREQERLSHAFDQPGLGTQGPIGAPETPGADTGQGTDWAKIGLGALSYAPSIYNVGMGLFSKPQQYNAADYQVQEKVPYRDIDFSPIQQSITTEGRTAAQNIRSASGGSPGTYLSNRTALGGILAKKRADSLMAAQQYNAQQQTATDQFNIGTNQFNKQMALNVANINAMNKGKKSEFLGKGLEGLSGIAQQSILNKNRAGVDEIKAGTLQDMFTNFRFNPVTGKWEYKS